MILSKQTLGKIQIHLIDDVFPIHKANEGTLSISLINNKIFINEDNDVDWIELNFNKDWVNTYLEDANYTGLAADTRYVLLYDDLKGANNFIHNDSGITTLISNSTLTYDIEHVTYASVNGSVQSDTTQTTNQIIQAYPIYDSIITNPSYYMNYELWEEKQSNTSFFNQNVGGLYSNDFLRYGVYSNLTGQINFVSTNLYAEVLQESTNIFYEDWENSEMAKLETSIEYLETFSGNTAFTYVNSDSNKWIVNSAVSYQDNFSMYISDDNYNYEYSENSGVSHSYIDYTFSDDSVLSFYWKCSGDSNNYGVVYMVDTGKTPVVNEYHANSIPSEISGWTSTLGTLYGDGSSSDNKPFEPYYDFTYEETIFKQSEIDIEGEITKISFEYDGNVITRPIKIWLYENSKNSYLDKSDWISTSDMTLVYDSTIQFIYGWNEITLDTIFEYSNTNNLIVATYMGGNYTDTSDQFFCWDSNDGNRNIMFRRDNTDIDTTIPPTATYISDVLPNMKLTIETPSYEPWVTEQEIIFNNLYNQNEYKKEKYDLIGFSGDTKRFVFTWVNSTGVTNPPISIDNFEIEIFSELRFDSPNWCVVQSDDLFWYQTSGYNSNYSIAAVSNINDLTYDTSNNSISYLCNSIYIPKYTNSLKCVLYENVELQSASYNLYIVPDSYTLSADTTIDDYTAIQLTTYSDWTKNVYDLTDYIITGNTKFVISMETTQNTGGTSFDNETEDFDVNNTIAKLEASGWTLDYADPTPSASNLFTFDTTYDRSAPNALRFSSYDYGDPNEYCWIISPRIYCNSGNTTFSFWYRKYTSGSEVFKVGWTDVENPTVSTTDGADDFTYTANITDASTTYQQYEKTDLPTGTTHVIIYYLGTYDYYLYIDDLILPPFDVTAPSGSTIYNAGYIDDVQLYML